MGNLGASADISRTMLGIVLLRVKPTNLVSAGLAGGTAPGKDAAAGAFARPGPVAADWTPAGPATCP